MEGVTSRRIKTVLYDCIRAMRNARTLLVTDAPEELDTVSDEAYQLITELPPDDTEVATRNMDPQWNPVDLALGHLDKQTRSDIAFILGVKL